MKHFLFICSRNQWRRPTAEAVFKKYPGIAARSAGTSRHARRSVTLADIHGAELIFVMEDKHKARLLATFPRALQYKTPLVLNISDDYPYMDVGLIDLLKTRMAPYLPKDDA